MKVCVFRSCLNTVELTPEKSYLKEAVVKELPKQCGRQVKIENDFPQNALVCEDNSNFEKNMENNVRMEQITTKPVLNKDTASNNCMGSKQVLSTHQSRKIQDPAIESSTQDPCKDIRVDGNVPSDSCGSYSQKEDKQLAASFSCMLCQHVFSSQDSLGAHFSNCITHLEFVHPSSASGSAANCTEITGLEKPELNKMYHCKVCFAKFAVKRTFERHQAKCEYQNKQGKQYKNSETSLMKPELPIFYYCNVCFVGFVEERAWESHLAKCEYHPKPGKKNQTALSTSFTKEPSKDVLHEKVIDDESWLVTSLPQGYECVDAMFVVEAEGTCMLQQQIPVEPEEEQLEILEEKKEQDVLLSDRGISPLEQDLLPPWPLSLLAGALEAEEEKEMMEQKLVLEPRFMQSAFMSMRGRPPEDFEEPEVENLEDSDY